MKLSDDSAPSMWEVIASKPKKRGPSGKVSPGMREHTLKKAREGPAALEDARLNLALHGVLNNDGSFKF